jgi:hypothetical protein
MSEDHKDNTGIIGAYAIWTGIEYPERPLPPILKREPVFQHSENCPMRRGPRGDELMECQCCAGSLSAPAVGASSAKKIRPGPAPPSHRRGTSYNSWEFPNCVRAVGLYRPRNRSKS